MSSGYYPAPFILNLGSPSLYSHSVTGFPETKTNNELNFVGPNFKTIRTNTFCSFFQNNLNWLESSKKPQ